MLLPSLIYRQGFLEGMFNDYINPATGSTWATQYQYTTTGAGQVLLRTPGIVAAQTAHLGAGSSCGSAEMEDYGGTGTAGSHWEFSSFMVRQQQPRQPRHLPALWLRRCPRCDLPAIYLH